MNNRVSDFLVCDCHWHWEWHEMLSCHWASQFSRQQ